MAFSLFRRRRLKSPTLMDIASIERATRARNQIAIRGLCMNAYLGNNWGLCRVLGRYKMFVDTTDRGLSTHLMLDGFWEIWVTEALIERVRPGMIAVDVGANLGYYSVLLADLVGETGHVHAFEPNPPIADRLRESCHVNGFYSNTTIHPEPLGAEDGLPVDLVVPHGEPKNAHIRPSGHIAATGDEGISHEKAATLTTRRLDSFPELLDADLIKIDAEGAEEDIWRGMAGIFARNRPLTIILEFAAARYANPAAFLDEILAHGFRLGEIDLRQGILPRTRAEILAAPAHLDQMLMLER
ncbi:FkbM family methyltransferase [Sphingomonas quercus]|uniref:FkbM family methyltransferase n=1 Tax=Sphingomonas quercus TaxID=2842451 RepID=A0ABS6BFV0_9SPHN|nr:FkbM family methyltransferase [Sphingomonas quercus]MBU3077159.1 FkbM family methyltransferase [Sphingomonas quercus]